MQKLALLVQRSSKRFFQRLLHRLVVQIGLCHFIASLRRCLLNSTVSLSHFRHLAGVEELIESFFGEAGLTGDLVDGLVDI